MDLIEIWDNKLPEGQKLEYKQYTFINGKFSSISDKEKNKLMYVLSSLANSDGGTIILGIGEDDNHNPAKLIDVGIDEESFETWEQSFRQYISSRVRPMIHGIKCSLENIEGTNLVQIDIPMSLPKPHAVSNGSKDELYIRYGNMTTPMRFDDMRRAFSEDAVIENKIINFKNERLSMFMGGDILGELEDNSVMVIHIIPEISMKIDSYIDLSKAEKHQKLDVFSPTSAGYRKGMAIYNIDGLSIVYEGVENEKQAFTQLFHNGIIEVAEVRMMNIINQNNGEKMIYDWTEMEMLITKKIHDFINVMIDIEIRQPYLVFVTLLNVKGKRSRGDFELHPKTPFPRSIVSSMPAYISEEVDYTAAMYPLLTSMANAFGFKRSRMYFEDGKPNNERFQSLK